MKNLITLLFIFTFAGNLANGQNVIRQAACSNEGISFQADSLKKAFARDGFVVVKEASVTMESEYEMPVIVPLTEGSWYHFVFIGDPSSRLYEVRMFDWNERQVVYEKNLSGDEHANVISYSYIPKFSEYHMIKPLQVNKKKKKGICGYVILLKKVQNSGERSG